MHIFISSRHMDPKLCRICLNLEGKLYHMKQFHLSQAYELVTGLSFTETRLPHHLCAECGTRLLNYASFREKSARAHHILLSILTTDGQFTEENLKSVDRETENLTSRLKYKRIEPDYFDYTFQENEDSHLETDELPSIHEVNIDVEIKDENGDFDNKSIDGSIKSGLSNPISDVSSDDDEPITKKIQTRKIRKKELRKKKRKKETKIDKRRKSLGDNLDEKIFTSSYLNNEEQILEFQKRQESSNYKNAVYKCTNCFKGFLDEEAYNNHMIRHTDQCGTYECDICKIHFKQSHALRNHVTSHTHKFCCKCCPYVTFRKQTAKLHEEWHNGTKYQCPHCQEEFLKFTTYMGHIRIKHPSDCVCQLCGYSFVSEKGLRLHSKLKHRLDEFKEIPQNGPYCDQCDVRFFSEEAHRRHLQVSSRHNETVDTDSKENSTKKTRKPRENRDKNKEAEDSEQKKKKRPNIKPEGPIPCEQCNMQLEDSRAYYKHFRRMHPDKNRTNYPSMKSPCMCEVCGRMFQTLALLLDHRWVHTAEKRFQCELCHKTFQQKQRLVAHRHIHSLERTSYVCSVCGKTFTTHSNRQRHMFSHTGLKPYKCEMCGKGFKHASEKRAHVTYVHLKKPWPKRARNRRPRDAGTQDQIVHRDASVREMDIVEPLWPSCADPKSALHLAQEKQSYYNLKI